MFMSGMNPTSVHVMVSTLLIAVPSAIKVFNWLGTMWRGNLRFHVPMLNAIGFVSMFTIGACPASSWRRRRWTFRCTTRNSSSRTSTTCCSAVVVRAVRGDHVLYPKMFGRMMSERIARCISF